MVRISTRKEKRLEISYTEKEFDFAQELGKPILGFIHINPNNPKPKKYDGTPDAELTETFNSKKHRKLLKFHEKLKKNSDGSDRTIGYWINEFDLKDKVKTALEFKINNETDETKGWVRADKVVALEKVVDKKNEQILALTKERDDLIIKNTDFENELSLHKADSIVGMKKFQLLKRVITILEIIKDNIWIF